MHLKLGRPSSARFHLPEEPGTCSADFGEEVVGDCCRLDEVDEGVLRSTLEETMSRNLVTVGEDEAFRFAFFNDDPCGWSLRANFYSRFAGCIGNAFEIAPVPPRANPRRGMLRRFLPCSDGANIGVPGERTPRNVPMIPEAEHGGLSTSVSTTGRGSRSRSCHELNLLYLSPLERS